MGEFAGRLGFGVKRLRWMQIERVSGIGRLDLGLGVQRLFTGFYGDWVIGVGIGCAKIVYWIFMGICMVKACGAMYGYIHLLDRHWYQHRRPCQVVVVASIDLRLSIYARVFFLTAMSWGVLASHMLVSKNWDWQCELCLVKSIKHFCSTTCVESI